MTCRNENQISSTSKSWWFCFCPCRFAFSTMVQYYEDLYRILSIYHYQWPPSLSHQHVVALIVNWPRDSIIPAALSSHAILVQQESKTRQFFFNPINVSSPPSDTKNTKSPDCLNSMFDPSSALNIKVFLTPQNTGNYKRSATPLLHTVLHTRFRPKSGSIGLGK